MPIQIDNTPNPNALKFTIGRPVGGPATFSAAKPTDDPLGLALLEVDGVASVFMTADFVTITRDPGASWEMIAATVAPILESHFELD
jgi:hypothetical protein